jgi:hypothetical protein
MALSEEDARNIVRENWGFEADVKYDSSAPGAPCLVGVRAGPPLFEPPVLMAEVRGRGITWEQAFADSGLHGFPIPGY